MRIKTILIPSIFLLFIMLSGCGRQKALLYSPTRNPTPLFENQGDVFTDIAIGYLKMDITAGFAPTNFAAIYAGASVGSNNHSSDAIIFRPVTYTKFRYHQENYNLGAGYFLNQKISQNFRFEIFGDIGIGQFSNKNEVHWRNSSATSISGLNMSVSHELSGHYQRKGILANFGFNNPLDGSNFTYSIRASHLRFSYITFDDSTYWEKYVSAFNEKTTYNLLEHNISIKFGHRDHLKFHVNLGVSHYKTL